MEVVNNLTLEMDKFHSCMYPSYFYSPQSYYDTDSRAGSTIRLPFRVPGSTAGHVVVSLDLTIQEVVFYDSNYDPFRVEVREHMKQFVGTKFDITGFEGVVSEK